MIVSISLSSYETSIDMETVTISPKFQVVIPKMVRESLRLRPGEKLRMFPYENRVELIPVRPVQELRGLLRGMETTIECEDDRL
jgi:AbrB family looped-hinge helix DNA binding protein